MTNLSVVQLRSDSLAQNNIETVSRLLKTLSPTPGQLVLLPENALCFGDKKAYVELAETLGHGIYQAKLAQLAKHYQCYLVCGSFPIKSTKSTHIYTTSLVFSPQGELISHYHKVHLFDALVSDNKAVYKESDTFEAGQSLQLFDWKTAQGNFKVGLAICYDLRFPALFQSLRAQGADILLLPAAFTQVTGAAHWTPLLQARAIENQCYVVAANQGGKHACGRQTYGHSMLISPWGEILEELDIHEGVARCEFSKTVIDDVRHSMPVMAHNRFNSVLK